MSRYRVVLPGGPQGPFYSLVTVEGRVVALQIPSAKDAEFLATAPQMLDLLRRVWEDPAMPTLGTDLLRDLDQFILREVS